MRISYKHFSLSLITQVQKNQSHIILVICNMFHPTTILYINIYNYVDHILNQESLRRVRILQTLLGHKFQRVSRERYKIDERVHKLLDRRIDQIPQIQIRVITILYDIIAIKLVHFSTPVEQ